MYIQKYFRGDTVLYNKNIHEVKSFDPSDDTYLIEEVSHTLNGFNPSFWAAGDDLSLWSRATSTSSNNASIKIPAGYKMEWDGRIGATPTYANPKCSHFWVVDYVSPFVAKEYHSCKYCKMKKEEYEKDSKDMF